MGTYAAAQRAGAPWGPVARGYGKTQTERTEAARLRSARQGFCWAPEQRQQGVGWRLPGGTLSPRPLWQRPPGLHAGLPDVAPAPGPLGSRPWRLERSCRCICGAATRPERGLTSRRHQAERGPPPFHPAPETVGRVPSRTFMDAEEPTPGPERDSTSGSSGLRSEPRSPFTAGRSRAGRGWQGRVPKDLGRCVGWGQRLFPGGAQ